MDKSAEEQLRETYPEIITKEQLYKICKVSKRTASFLLESGTIPNICSGKQTRKYKIRLDDVICYLYNSGEYVSSANASAGYCKKKKSSKHITFYSEARVNKIRSYLTYHLAKYDEVLTVKDICEILGYCDTSVVNWYNKGVLKGFKVNHRIMIPKQYFVDFVVSPYCQSIERKTKKHTKLIYNASRYTSASAAHK